jgi:orotate phosphoribosyltransferase
MSSKVAKGAILELYNHYSIYSDCIIGIGQEGIILGSFLACEKSLPFLSTPHHSRKKDHSKHETELNLDDYKKITFITAVACTGMSIAEILTEKETVFKNVEIVSLISLFYISKDTEYQADIFKNLDNRLNFYTVCDKIRIDKCKDETKNECSIFNNKLEKVHIFYDGSE